MSRIEIGLSCCSALATVKGCFVVMLAEMSGDIVLRLSGLIDAFV